MPARLFSDVEIVWLRMTYPVQTADETLWLFNETWDRSITKAQLKSAASRFRLGKSKDWEKARFQVGDPRSGVKTPEQRAAFLESGKKTRFKKGNVPENVLPLYSERWSHGNNGKRRYREIKIPGPSHKPSLRKLGTEFAGHWVGKAKWIWEQANGPVPEGHVVAVLDGDEANCALANLECVPKAVLARRNAFHAPTPAPGDKDAYKATIRIAQIKEAIATR